MLSLVFSDTVKISAANALHMWASQLVPVLFPFFICADMLRRFQGGRASLPLLFFISALAGAPAGARLCTVYPADVKERTDTVAALNMISPMFIFSAYCGDMLKNPFLAIPILLSQYLSAVIMLVLSRRSVSYDIAPEQQTRQQNVFLTLSSSIYDAVCAMLSIGGTIVFFKVLLSILESLCLFFQLPSLSPAGAALAAGLLEFVNGCSMLSACRLSTHFSAALSAFLFSFGGLCVMAQSMHFAQLLPGRYLFKKLLQGALAAIIAYGLSFLMFQKDQSVFYSFNADLLKANTLSALGMLADSSLSLGFLWLIQYALQKRKTARTRAVK